MATETPHRLDIRDKLYIGGQWVDPTGDGTIEVVNASTEEVMARIPAGTRPMISSVVELMTSIVSALAGSTQSPAM